MKITKYETCALYQCMHLSHRDVREASPEILHLAYTEKNQLKIRCLGPAGGVNMDILRRCFAYSKICVKRPLSKRPKIDLQVTLSEIKRDFPMEFPFFDSKT